MDGVSSMWMGREWFQRSPSFTSGVDAIMQHWHGAEFFVCSHVCVLVHSYAYHLYAAKKTPLPSRHLVLLQHSAMWTFVSSLGPLSIPHPHFHVDTSNCSFLSRSTLYQPLSSPKAPVWSQPLSNFLYIQNSVCSANVTLLAQNLAQNIQNSAQGPSLNSVG